MRDLDAALERAAQMVAEGAAIIDVGGESTRPGAAAVDAAVEIERVVPVIERIAAESRRGDFHRYQQARGDGGGGRGRRLHRQ